MKEKKLNKRLTHARMVWEREQIKAAMVAEHLDKAIATVEQYRDELSEEQIAAVHDQVETRRKDLEEYVLKAKNKYLAKLEELGIDPTLAKTGESTADSLEEL